MGALFLQNGYAVDFDNKVENAVNQSTQKATSKITELSAQICAVTVETSNTGKDGLTYKFTTSPY